MMSGIAGFVVSATGLRGKSLNGRGSSLLAGLSVSENVLSGRLRMVRWTTRRDPIGSKSGETAAGQGGGRAPWTHTA